jgi:hypothetical protein
MPFESSFVYHGENWPRKLYSHNNVHLLYALQYLVLQGDPAKHGALQYLVLQGDPAKHGNYRPNTALCALLSTETTGRKHSVERYAYCPI